MSDVAKMTRMALIATPGSTLKKVLDEVVAIVPKVVQWRTVPTSGSAVCRYNTNSGKPSGYEINYQQGNIGNLVHELIHAAVNEAYEHDFVNYPNRNANPPARTYDAHGRCTNEFDRQTAYMDQAENTKISGTLTTLTMWANASTELSTQQKTDIVSKLSYGMQWPHKEYDTVITQVLVWLYEWGYPIKNPSAAKKPVVNALYEEVEKAVEAARRRRAAGP